jgi:hypothetical protein
MSDERQNAGTQITTGLYLRDRFGPPDRVWNLKVYEN